MINCHLPSEHFLIARHKNKVRDNFNLDRVPQDANTVLI